jgi:hypothetical protein
MQWPERENLLAAARFLRAAMRLMVKGVSDEKISPRACNRLHPDQNRKDDSKG